MCGAVRQQPRLTFVALESQHVAPDRAVGSESMLNLICSKRQGCIRAPRQTSFAVDMMDDCIRFSIPDGDVIFDSAAFPAASSPLLAQQMSRQPGATLTNSDYMTPEVNSLLALLSSFFAA